MANLSDEGGGGISLAPMFNLLAGILAGPLELRLVSGRGSPNADG